MDYGDALSTLYRYATAGISSDAEFDTVHGCYDVLVELIWRMEGLEK